MQIFILNFSRTRVDSVVQALGLNSIDPQDILKEYKIQDFYEDSFYKILKEVELINNSMEGGGQ